MGNDVDALKKKILRVVKQGPLADAVTDVQVEPACDEDGEDFLRVQLVVRLPEGDLDNQLVDLIERIEETVASVDARYPSVRFLDAA